MNIPRLALATLALSSGVAGFAQSATPPAGRRPPHHPPSALVRVLDANHDHVISADEIAAAATSLKTLDTNGDGKLSADELRPALPPGVVPPADATRPHPEDPLMLALDANGDGELSAAEIANAPTSLKALDANKDGQLTPDEFAPLPPKNAPQN